MKKTLLTLLAWGIALCMAPAATLTVTNTNDNGPGSLRQAIADAAPDNIILFASPLFDSPQEIQLNEQLFINKNLTINGPGANLLTLRQIAVGSRVIQIVDVTTVTLSGMTITGGNIGFANGAGITASNSIFPVPPDLVLNFSDLNITANSCGGGGCGIAVSTYNLNLVNSTVSNNTSSFCCGRGGSGGIQFSGGNTFNLVNSTVSGNTTANDSFDSGGGIGVALSFTNIINSTITDNGSNGGASGVRVEGGTMTVRNSIIAGNRNNAAVPDVTKASSTTVTSLGNNIIGNAPDAGFTNGVNNDQVGNSTSPLNPLLGSLANNGGPTPTHALLPTSPAIGNGNNCVLDLTCMTNNPPFALTTDQRGSPRSTPVDIGAYENFPCPSFNTLYVDQSTSSSGDGTSWATAFKTLDEALLIAHNCPGVTTINVAAGTYKPGTKPYENDAPITTADDRDVTFHLANGVALYGGFPNGGGTRDWAANPTILSGDFNGDDVVTGSGSTLSITNNGENAYHVVLSVSDAATTVLDGFTVRGGNANGSGNTSITVEGQVIFRYDGGGMFNHSSSPSITQTTFSGNSASARGGGMHNDASSSPSITNSTFTGNRANNDGGGMYNQFLSPRITNTTFSGNRANLGGGIYNDASSPSITNTTFSGNSATNQGGGMYNINSANPNIRNSILWGNGTEIANSSNSNPVVSYSIVQGGYAGTGNLDANPLFVNAASPAGPDGIHRTADDGLRLQVGSPAINTGSNAAIPASITTDITGLVPRIQEGTVDLGAYEFFCTDPAGEISVDLAAICVGQSIQLTFTATVGAGPFDIVVNSTPYNGVTSGNVFATFMLTSNTDYVLSQITDSNDCAVSGLSQQVTVTVNPLPTANVSAAATPICAGENAVFNLMGTANAEVTYNLNNGSDQTVNLDANGVAAVTVNNAIDNQIITLVSVRDTSTNCSQNLSDMATVVVNQPATVTAGTAQTICQTKTVDLVNIGASIGGSATTGVWSTSGDGTFTGGTAFGAATAYVPGANDKKSGSVNLTLTTTDAPEACPNVADQVRITILKVDCGAFPWSGN